MPDSVTDASQLLDAVSAAPKGKLLEATRYLAAAAHSDRIFRNAVLSQIVRPKFRCRAPEYGIDEKTIIEECRRADRRRKISDALLLTALLAFLLLTTLPSDIASFAQVVSKNQGEFSLPLPLHIGKLVELVIAGSVVLLIEALLRQHVTIRRRFASPANPMPGQATRCTEKPRQNMVVYGQYSPFVGSGLKLRDWSFSVSLHKTVAGGDRDGSSELSVETLTDFVRCRLDRLRISDLEHYHVLFADGRHIRNDHRLMPSPYNLPPRFVPDEILFEQGQELETRRRTYLCISVTDWSGEMVLTTYVRFKKGESNLFAEASTFIVPPLKQAYYQLDSMTPRLKLSHLAGLVAQSLFVAPFRILWCPISICRIIMEPVHHWSVARETLRAIRDNPSFNYGALTSIRQLGMENRFRVYFQQLDRDMHMKTVEQCLIDAIVDCLEEHDIDTSDIRERRTVILNTGVMVSGGVFNANSVAAGPDATSVVSEFPSMMSRGHANERHAGAIA